MTDERICAWCGFPIALDSIDYAIITKGDESFYYHHEGNGPPDPSVLREGSMGGGMTFKDDPTKRKVAQAIVSIASNIPPSFSRKYSRYEPLIKNVTVNVVDDDTVRVKVDIVDQRCRYFDVKVVEVGR